MAAVLILEDDFELAKSWQSALQDADHTVTLTRSSAEALQHVKAQAFDVVIVDLMLDAPHDQPTASGIHFLRSLKSEEPLPKMIGVSGYYGSDKGDMAQTVLNVFGVQHFLLKPFDPKSLVDLL